MNTGKKPAGNPNINNNNNNNNKQLKVIKQYFTMDEILKDPAKVKLYIDKLSVQLKEKVFHKIFQIFVSRFYFKN